MSESNKFLLSLPSHLKAIFLFFLIFITAVLPFPSPSHGDPGYVFSEGNTFLQINHWEKVSSHYVEEYYFSLMQDVPKEEMNEDRMFPQGPFFLGFTLHPFSSLSFRFFFKHYSNIFFQIISFFHFPTCEIPPPFVYDV